MRSLFLLIPLLGCGMDTTLPSKPNALVLEQDASAALPEWSEPVNLGPAINTAGLEQGPNLSPDALSLYFSSGRAGGLGGNDIWVAHRASLDSPWETPQNLGPTVNTVSNEGSPGLSRNGLLLFLPSNRPGGLGGNDIYVSQRSDPLDDFGWSVPVSLGPAVNTAAFDAGPKFVHLPGRRDYDTFLYFSRGQGSVTDTYEAPIDHDGMPLASATLVSELIDPSTAELTPAISSNGKEALVASERAGTLGAFDFWFFRRDHARDPWGPGVHLDAPLNTAYVEFQPALSNDGRTLVFSSTRPGGLGNFDIWTATRLR
jgi:hypothetical protein